MQIRQATAEDLDDILHLAFQVHAIHMALFPHIFKPAVGEATEKISGTRPYRYPMPSDGYRLGSATAAQLLASVQKSTTITRSRALAMRALC